MAGNRRLAIFGGATFPTGQTEDRTGPLPAPLRLGSGVVNLTGQAVYSHVNNRIGVHGAVAYTAAAASNGGERAGDRFGYDLALGWRLLPAAYQTLRDVTRCPTGRSKRRSSFPSSERSAACSSARTGPSP